MTFELKRATAPCPECGDDMELDDGALFCVTCDGNNVDAILEDVAEELNRATRKFARFNGAHEGYAVILEELDELWELVKAKPTFERDQAMRAEAVQVAAMAVRFLRDVCGHVATVRRETDA